MNNLLQTLSKDQREYLEIKSFHKNDIIFNEDDECKKIGILIKGRIDIVSYSFNGDELIYNSLKENMVFGNNLIFSSNPHYKGNVVCKEKSEVCFIDKLTLINLLQTNKEFLECYLRIQSDFGKTLNSQIKLLSYTSAEERFIYYLYSNNKVINYTSITDLASKVHLKRETLSRLITTLEKRRLIKRLNKQIILLD